MCILFIDNAIQVYDSEDTRSHFAEFASIFANLAEYRAALIENATAKGHPLIRHMAIQFGYDKNVWKLEEQYMFGEDFLIAPSMTENATSVNTYIPQFSGKNCESY